MMSLLKRLHTHQKYVVELTLCNQNRTLQTVDLILIPVLFRVCAGISQLPKRTYYVASMKCFLRNLSSKNARVLLHTNIPQFNNTLQEIACYIRRLIWCIKIGLSSYCVFSFLTLTP